jgi:basic membrane lipoprotein Med (substrate-binding protein (PBP1-ABC) superfamily)
MKNFFKHKMRGKSPGEIIGIVIFGVIAITGLAILFGFIIMWLWNWLMPEIFGLPTLNYWQAVGLFILLKILLCSGGGSGGKSSKKSKHECDKDSKREFSKWKYYDKFWKEEGNTLYKDYVERMKNDASNSTNEPEPPKTKV